MSIAHEDMLALNTTWTLRLESHVVKLQLPCEESKVTSHSLPLGSPKCGLASFRLLRFNTPHIAAF